MLGSVLGTVSTTVNETVFMDSLERKASNKELQEPSTEVQTVTPTRCWCRESLERGP